MVICSNCGHENVDNDNATVIGNVSEKNKTSISVKPGAESNLVIPISTLDTQVIIGVVTNLLPGSCSGFISDEIYFRTSLVHSLAPLNVGDKVVVEARRLPDDGKGTPFKYKALKVCKVDLDLLESAAIKHRRHVKAPSKSAKSQHFNNYQDEMREETANSFFGCEDDEDSQSLADFLSQFRRNPHAQQKPETYVPIPQSTQLKCFRCHDSSHEGQACTLTRSEARILLHQRILATEGPDGLARYKREQNRMAKIKKKENKARKEWEFRNERFQCITGNQNHTETKRVEVNQPTLGTPSISEPVSNTLKTSTSRENPNPNNDDHDHEDSSKVLEFDLSRVKQEVMDELSSWNINDDNAVIDDKKELKNTGNEAINEETQNCKNCSAKTHETINCVSANREYRNMQRKLAEQQILNDGGPEALRIFKNERNRSSKAYSKNSTWRLKQWESQIRGDGPPPISPSLPEQAEDEKEDGELCENIYFRSGEGQDPVLKRCIQCLDFSHKVNFCPYRFKEMQTVEILEALKSRREKFRESHGHDMLNLYMDALTLYCQQQVARKDNAKRKLQELPRTKPPYQETAKRFKNSNQSSTLDAPQNHGFTTFTPAESQPQPPGLMEMNVSYHPYHLNSYEIPPPQFDYVAPPPGALPLENNFANYQDSFWNDNYF